MPKFQIFLHRSVFNELTMEFKHIVLTHVLHFYIIAKPVFFCQTADDGAQRCESFKVAMSSVLKPLILLRNRRQVSVIFWFL